MSQNGIMSVTASSVSTDSVTRDSVTAIDTTSSVSSDSSKETISIDEVERALQNMKITPAFFKFCENNHVPYPMMNDIVVKHYLQSQSDLMQSKSVESKTEQNTKKNKIESFEDAKKIINDFVDECSYGLAISTEVEEAEQAWKYVKEHNGGLKDGVSHDATSLQNLMITDELFFSFKTTITEFIDKCEAHTATSSDETNAEQAFQGIQIYSNAQS